MAADILVTATSFMKSPLLRVDLERILPSGSSVTYLDLRNPIQKAQFDDPVFAGSVRGWLVGGEAVTQTQLTHFPQLQIISKYGVGVDNIDFAACAKAKVPVHFEPGVNAMAVAEHTLGLIIGMCRNIRTNSVKLSQGQWNKDGGRGLHGMKVGIIGLGHVGSKVATLLSYLGADLAYTDIISKPELESSLRIQRLDYASLLSWAELLSFHVPLTDETRNMFGEEELSLSRTSVFVVNTSRGEVIETEALKRGLRLGQIAGAALDVFEKEPLHDKELAESDRLLGTPHTAGNSEQAVFAMGQAAIRGIKTLFAKTTET
ncbi:MAG: hypothetical protein H7249_18450 [Chitinophagaceae bacterium]|nr:hypothetical protein [Oligoflexus sp.]